MCPAAFFVEVISMTTSQPTNPTDGDPPSLALTDLTPDPRNARRHTERNLSQIETSLREVGAARSIVVDETGTILAGNATVQAASQVGIERVRVIETDGSELVAVRRTGLSPEQKRRLALFDNRAAELAEWDAGVLAALADETDLSALWDDEELSAILAHAAPPDVEFPEYDESAEEQVQWLTCPECGHRFPA
jgi:ParB-like chromosome segregation protein Spo0J